jgi:hypothetical protein
VGIGIIGVDFTAKRSIYVPNNFPKPMPDTNEPALLDALAQRGARRNYRKGTLLIQEGDTGDTVFIVLEGRVKVFAIQKSWPAVRLCRDALSSLLKDLAKDVQLRRDRSQTRLSQLRKLDIFSIVATGESSCLRISLMTNNLNSLDRNSLLLLH